MAWTATFQADFKQFDQAISEITPKLGAVEQDAKKVARSLQKITSDFDGSKLTSQAQTAARAVEQIGGVTKLTEAEQRKLTATVGEAMAKYRALGVEAPAAVSKLSSELQEASRSGGGLAGTLGTIKQAALGAFAGFSAAGLVSGAISGIKSLASQAVDTAGMLTDLSAQTGVAASSLDRMRLAAAPAGVEIGSITNVIAGMSDKLISGDKSAVAGLKALGLNLKTLQQSKPDEAFLSIVEALAKIPDPMTRTKVAFDVLGGRAKEVLKIVNDEFVDSARNGDAWSEAQIKALDDAGDAWGKLRDNAVLFSGQTIAAAFASLDALDKAAQGLGAWIDARNGTAKKVGPWTGAGKGATIGAANSSVRPDGQYVYAATAIPDADKAKVEKALDDFRKKWAELGRVVIDTKTATAGVVEELDRAGWDRHLAALFKASAAYRDLAVFSAAAAQGMASAAQARAGGYLMAAQATLPDVVSGIPAGLGQSVWTPGVSPGLFSPTSRTGPKVAGFSSLYGWDALKGQLPSQIVGAFTGGGNVGGGLGAIAGGMGGTALGGMFSTIASSGFLSAGLSTALGAAGNILPVIGPILGGMLGKAIGGLFGPSKNAIATNEANGRIDQSKTSLLGQYGSLEAIRGTNQAGEALAAAWNSRGVAGEQQFNRLAAEFTAQVKAQNDLLDEQTQKQSELVGYQERLNALAESLTPKWASVQGILEKYGITLEQAGKGVQQLATTADWEAMINALDELERAGADTGGVLAGMADEASKAVQNALKLGTEIPENGKKYVEYLATTGQLLDENGDKITDLAGIKWGAPVKTQAEIVRDQMTQIADAMKIVTDRLAAIADALTRMLPAAAAEGAQATQDAWNRNRPTFDVDTGDGGRDGDASTGYASGGVVTRPRRAWLAEGGQAEIVGSRDFMADAIARAQAMNGGGGLGYGGPIVVDASIRLNEYELGRQLITILPQAARRAGVQIPR